MVKRSPLDADLILKAMVAVAAADGRLNAREVGLIQKVYRDQTGQTVDVAGVMYAVQAYASKRNALAEISAVAGSMSHGTKEGIIRAAYLTLLADDRVAGEEDERLKAIASACHLSENDLAAMLKDLAPESEERS